MDRKVSFAYYWTPKYSKAVSKTSTPNSFISSPCFCTVYSQIAFKWRINFSPSGTENNPDESLIFLQLVDYPVRKKFSVEAEMEMELLSNTVEKIWCRKETFKFRSVPFSEYTEGGKGFVFGPKMETKATSVLQITDGRIFIRCHLRIPTDEFFRYEHDVEFFYWIPVDEGKKFSNEDYNSSDYGEIAAKHVCGFVCAKNDSICKMLEHFTSDSQPDLAKVIGKRNEEPDITVVSNDGREVICHSQILGGRSEILNKMFTADFLECNNRRATFDDIDGDTLEEFVSYMYSDRLSQKSKSIAPNLLNLAEKYLVADLKPVCENLMLQTLTKHNVWSYLQFAKTFDLKNVEAMALETVVTNYDFCFKMDEYHELLKNKNDEILMSVMKFACQRAKSSLSAVGDY